MVEDPKTITRATRLIWAAHNLERSADRITNICERTCFRPLIIVDNIWRRVSGLEITAAYSQFMDAGLLHSFLNI
jgi:phosphate uptake regulator